MIERKNIAAWTRDVTDGWRHTQMNDIDDAIRKAIRPVRGCATDEQYQDVYERVAALVREAELRGWEQMRRFVGG